MNMTQKRNSLLEIQKPPAEKLYAEELERLHTTLDFVLGDTNSGISQVRRRTKLYRMLYRCPPPRAAKEGPRSGLRRYEVR
ncbi:hypothetical protein LEP1GSC168_0828 [Leptospira santarosai str. HAI134]|nr:hypothetical protein LEP1GSC168_0828 [Leptospira santarosai str. HAI134]